MAGAKTADHAAADVDKAAAQATAARKAAAQAQARAAEARAEARAEQEAAGEAEAQAEKVAESCLNSFPGKTLVLLGNGTTTRIDRVQVGDWVESTDPATGQTVAEPVTAVIVTLTDRDYTDTTIRTADGGTATVTSTQHHRYWDVTRHAWVHAADLRPGDLLREPDGTWTTVVHIRNYHTHTTTYNLTVTTLHTYYILAANTAILVHNCGPNLESLSAAANTELKRGVTNASRAYQKHMGRPGTTLIQLGGRDARDMRQSYTHPKFGPVFDFRLPDIGARWSQTGRFIGFLD